MADLQLVLGGPWTPPAPLAPKAPEDQLIESMLEAGLTPPDHVILDGRIVTLRLPRRAKLPLIRLSRYGLVAFKQQPIIRICQKKAYRHTAHG